MAHPQAYWAGQVGIGVVAAEVQRVDIGGDQLVTALELLAEQLLDDHRIHVEQRRKRADINNILE